MGFKTRYDFTTGRVATVATIATRNGEKHDFPQSVAKVAEVAGGESQKNRVELLPLPETPSTGDQEHGGAASDAMETPRDDGPDEFAAHVAQVRGAWPDGPPMIAQDMPDWRAFCAGYPDVCGQCPYYDANPSGSPCALWEAAFPCKVRWYPPNY